MFMRVGRLSFPAIEQRASCRDELEQDIGIGTFAVNQHALGLRAGDALHLTTASEHGATLHTLHQRLAEAGPLVGVPTRLLA